MFASRYIVALFVLFSTASLQVGALPLALPGPGSNTASSLAFYRRCKTDNIAWYLSKFPNYRAQAIVDKIYTPSSMAKRSLDGSGLTESNALSDSSSLQSSHSSSGDQSILKASKSLTDDVSESKARPSHKYHRYDVASLNAYFSKVAARRKARKVEQAAAKENVGSKQAAGSV